MDAVRRDIFKNRLTREELTEILDRAGAMAHEVLSTRSRPYKELGLRDRAVSDDELIDLMIEHPALIRRPLIISEHGALVGFNRPALSNLVHESRDGG